MIKYYIAIWSNLETENMDRLEILNKALEYFPMFSISLVKVSSFWESKSYPNKNQPNFINAVSEVQSILNPHQTLCSLKKIEIILEETSSNLLLAIKDEGPGFAETSPQKIFKRFYSNRPTSFGKHSGLGLNIAKNIVQLHKGTIAASNRINTKGAQVEVLLPKFS